MLYLDKSDDHSELCVEHIKDEEIPFLDPCSSDIHSGRTDSYSELPHCFNNKGEENYHPESTSAEYARRAASHLSFLSGEIAILETW